MAAIRLENHLRILTQWDGGSEYRPAVLTAVSMSFERRSLSNHRVLFARGFTILEMIIYTAIVGMILTTVVYVTNTVYNVRARVSTSSVVHESVVYAQDRILTSLHAATAVVVPASGASSTLQLTMPDPMRDPTVYSLSGGRIWVKEGTKAKLPLTSSEISVSNLEFMRGTNLPPIIRIQITADRRNAKRAYSAPLSVTTTAAIRLEQ